MVELERRGCEDVMVGGSRRLVSSSSFVVWFSVEGVIEEYGNRVPREGHPGHAWTRSRGRWDRDGALSL